MERANIVEHYDTFREKQEVTLEEQEELSLGDRGISTAQSSMTFLVSTLSQLLLS